MRLWEVTGRHGKNAKFDNLRDIKKRVTRTKAAFTDLYNIWKTWARQEPWLKYFEKYTNASL